MTLGKPTPLGQLCLAIDAMVVEGRTLTQIEHEVDKYYTRLQRAALEQGVTVRVVANITPQRRSTDVTS